MNISVISPHVHGNGSTTIASLIAAELSTKNKKVLLSHTKSQSDSFFPYFNFDANDKSNNAMSLVSLIENGGFNKDNIPDYCRSVAENLDLFSLDTDSELVRNESLSEVIEFMMVNAPYDYIIYDVDEHNLKSPEVETVLYHSDCVVLILTQAKTELNRFCLSKN